MREVYTVRRLRDDMLIETNTFSNHVAERSLFWRGYFGWYAVLHPGIPRIPDHIRLKIDEGVEPYTSAAIYDWIRTDTQLRAPHRMLLKAQITPQIIDTPRFCKMFYGSRNTSGVWSQVDDNDYVVLRANGVNTIPEPFANHVPADVLTLPQLIHDELHAMDCA